MNSEPMDTISTQADEFDTNFEPKPISPQLIEELKAEALNIKVLFDKFEQEFVTAEVDFYHILSKRWFNKWKRYVSYDEITSGKEPNSQFFGQIKPGGMNEDIVVNPELAVKYSDENHYANVFLKDQLQADVDYIIISEAIWKELKAKYPGIEVKRPVITLPSGQKRVEVRLKSFELVFVNNQFFRNVDHKRVMKFTTHRVQMFSQITVKDFKKDLLSVLNSSASGDYLSGSHRIHHPLASQLDDDSVRMWHLDPQYNLEQAFEYVRDICNKTTSYDYKIPFKGEFLEKFPEKAMEETNVADTDIVFVEIKEAGRNWDFTHPDVPTVERCECCAKYGMLKYPCACGKVAYCSEECKQKDKRFHLPRCTKAEDEEESTELQETPQSVLGLCGLQNLGNTCFMNSGLQCLSNFRELTEYMLRGYFKHEINETNPLGTKGKLVKKYANLVRNLWYGTSNVFSPWSFKHGLAQFQPMFSGYQQHDSQEFLNFLLDGLHEDLNRVKDKPFVEQLECDNEADDTIPRKSWYNHLKRNQSVIVDLLHGQFRSQLTCPDCNRVSITYDPFMSVSLPLNVAKKQKEIEFFFVHKDLKEKAYKVTISFPTKDHTLKDLKLETSKLVKKDPSTFYFVFLSQLSKEVVEDERTSTNALRKKRKIKNLFAIEMTEEDMNIPKETRIDVDFTLTKKSTNYFGNVIRKPFTFMRTIRFETTYTTKQVYMKVFKMYRFLYDEYLPEVQRESWLKLSDEEAFKQIFEDLEPGKRHFKILLSTNTRGFQECYFCGQRRCENCELECSDKLRLDTDVLAKIKDKDFQLEMELYFENIPEEVDTGRLNTCVDLRKKLAEERGEDPNKSAGPEPAKEGGTLIYDCFRQFEQPEQLGADNEWYCNKCKKHQRAFKKMEIYKAPSVLIVHLKRFKAGGGFGSGKIQTLVNFPTRDLDLTEFVKNHELPMDYPINMPPRTKAEQEALAALEKEKGTAEIMMKKVENNESAKSNEEEKDSKGNHKLQYDLFGIVNHYGSTGFGHYTAYGKNFRTGKWYCFDDSSVHPENESAVCTPAAYVLFYKRKDWEFNMPEPTPVQTTGDANNTTIVSNQNNETQDTSSSQIQDQ